MGHGEIMEGVIGKDYLNCSLKNSQDLGRLKGKIRE